MGGRAQGHGARRGGHRLATPGCALTGLVSGLACWMATAAGQALPSVRVDWLAPDSCPAADWVRGDIERRLGRTLEALTELSLVAEAVVTPTDDGRFQLVLTTIVEGEPGERTLDDRDCPALASAASLIIALAIDPAASQTDETPTAVALPMPEDSDATTAPDETSASPPRAPLGFHVRLDLVADLGALPGLAAGPAVSLGLSVDRLRLELSGVWLLPGDAQPQSEPRAVAELQLLAIGVGACLRLFESGLLQTGPCGRLEYGTMRGHGSRAISEPTAGDAGWAAAHAGGWMSLKIGSHAAFRLELGLGLPLRRAKFTVEGLGTVHEASPVNLRSRLGVELNF